MPRVMGRAPWGGRTPSGVCRAAVVSLAHSLVLSVRSAGPRPRAGFVFREPKDGGPIRVTYVVNVNPNGWIPARLVNFICNSQAMNVSRIKNKFAETAKVRQSVKGITVAGGPMRSGCAAGGRRGQPGGKPVRCSGLLRRRCRRTRVPEVCFSCPGKLALFSFGQMVLDRTQSLDGIV